MPEESNKKRVNMAELILRGVEEIYITSINKETKTFFSQCTKFPNEDLINLNFSANDYCQKILKVRENGNSNFRRPTSVSSGEIYFCQYNVDNCWYRSQVLSRDKINKRCKVLFIDYGNVATLAYDKLIEVDVQEVPLLEHCPFGAPCYAKEFEDYDGEKIDTLLDYILENYATVIFAEKQSRIQWLVELPRCGNNSNFWKPFASYLKQQKQKPKETTKKITFKVECAEEEVDFKKLRAVVDWDKNGGW